MNTETVQGKKSTKDEVMFKVFAPRALEPILMCFDLSTKVGHVADIARDKFGYEAGTYTLQNDKDEPLEREKTLKDVHSKCGDSFELVSTGGGVFLIPPPAVLTYIEKEISATIELCKRKGLEYEWDEQNLQFKITLLQSATNEKFCLVGTFNDYPAICPAWQFNGISPRSENTKFGASIFHANGVICAPFNRLAYQEKGGPHGDWGGCTNWKSVRGGNMVLALSIPDMVGVIFRDFSVTKGKL